MLWSLGLVAILADLSFRQWGGDFDLASDITDEEKLNRTTDYESKPSGRDISGVPGGDANIRGERDEPKDTEEWQGDAGPAVVESVWGPKKQTPPELTE
ncbi:hypothetical protein Ocin01_15814 [Orchesella cincta]|uniref:Uncharacterized protein n=1 Tax=Orchesella cincta TaxID=48709 RepID=A0A1D2MD81_ORCCI|nr:hypothetical protein Ocin01_15814 [Orchesella cincta]